MIDLILASSSIYRQQLLSRLAIPFTSISPDIDETPQSGETADALVRRLSTAKAQIIAKQYPGSIVIGSDQVAVANKQILHKPGNHKNAVEQLHKLSGQPVTFHTGLCVIERLNHRLSVDTVQYTVFMRELRRDQIERYLRHEQPYDCAGSFKSEGLGITLFSAMQGNDPTALIGLPLIRLSEILNDAGLSLP